MCDRRRTRLAGKTERWGPELGGGSSKFRGRSWGAGTRRTVIPGAGGWEPPENSGGEGEICPVVGQW